uniref:L,D-transpeptidase n=1 Tax=Gordonia sp. B7-2 TaxID=3420932 RepID=UPI003D939DDA
MIRSTSAARAKEHAWSLVLVVAASVVTVLVVAQLGNTDRGSADARPLPVDRIVASPTAPPTPAIDCLGNRAARMVKVSLGEQMMAMCARERVVATSLVTTGSVALRHGTPLGSWRINSRETDRHLSGPDYRVFVHYWLPFFRDYGFHDSSWQKFPYGDQVQYRTRGSRGCIRAAPGHGQALSLGPRRHNGDHRAMTIGLLRPNSIPGQMWPGHTLCRIGSTGCCSAQILQQDTECR